jgi:hypothetical protein
LFVDADVTEQPASILDREESNDVWMLQKTQFAEFLNSFFGIGSRFTHRYSKPEAIREAKFG